MRSRALLSAGALLLLAASGVQAQTTYVAFGDSITQGVGDSTTREEKGYPPRLEALLQQRGQNAEVRNEGLAGETVEEGVTRITAAIDAGDDVLLLMEGTNDIGLRVSNETIAFNVSRIADKAELRGLSVVHATVLPRLNTNVDPVNLITSDFNGRIRDLAWREERRLADPFEVFLTQPGGYAPLYDDKLHPNAAGYDLLARVFADVLTNVDNVPPVTGRVSPPNDAQNVSPDAPLVIDLYDFGTGIDVANTRLVINDQVVDTPITGTQRKLEIRYTPPQPWRGVPIVRLRSRDLASPPNQLDREVTQFVVAGTTFLKGDIDRDGRVDGTDLLAFAPTFGSRRGDGRFAGFADLNVDDQVDGADLAMLAANFGKTSF